MYELILTRSESVNQAILICVLSCEYSIRKVGQKKTLNSAKCMSRSDCRVQEKSVIEKMKVSRLQNEYAH